MTRSRTEKLTLTALFCSFALILSYVEAVIPFELLIPVPGFKPGLANVAVMLGMFILGPLPALGISAVKITLSSILFGSPVSFLFSLSGGALSYLALLLSYYVFGKTFGCVGISVISAAAHSIGQTLAASALYGSGILFYYLPYILLLSIMTGTVSGILLYYVQINFPTGHSGKTKNKDNL